MSALAAQATAAPNAAPNAADLQPETLSVQALAPADDGRLYISDVAFKHMVDGRLHVVDGKGMRYLGLVPTAFGGQSVLSPDKRTLYVISTFYTRLARGERTDVVRNATPATSVSIVDLQAGKFVAEAQTPGCWGVFATEASSQRFRTLCSDGTMLTVTHDAAGQPSGQKRSARMFDPDADPVFLHSERVGNTLTFVSFNGNVYSADLSSETPVFAQPWPVVDAADRKAGWKPGGYQLFALHAATGRLYLGMHPRSKEGSHKTPAAEIWTIDLAQHKRVARAPGQNALALTITQGPQPTLYVLDAAKAGVVSLDPARGLKPVARLDQVAENAVQLELHQ
ncbi:amine dehydrogenase [Cupriavidus basilensis OR16]|uniref:Amine dehydrogenase n=1 Tax=Cupriavidus basilensis OR16 TaxID=1127483 RepID=H1SHR7_9BURK|nr:amine dehydrogenase [Cupriavidus basilensis OR16]